MKPLLLACVIVTTAGVMREHVVGQSARTLQGAWQITQIEVTGPAARTITLPEPRANLIIFTPKHYSRVEVQSPTPRPVLGNVPEASADQLRATWGPFVGEAGTYEATDGVITMHPIASKNPAVMGPGVFISYTFAVSNDRLTLTQRGNQSGSFPNPFTLRAVRVE